MTLKDRVKALAQERGISLPALESELGFGNSTIVKWDKSTPNADKLNAVAKYFNVTMDYLLNGDNETHTELNARDERDIKKDLDSLREKLENKEFGPAAYDGEDIPDEDVDLFLGQVELMLRRLKVKNKAKYNPNKSKK